jgi:hypothetical protein
MDHLADFSDHRTNSLGWQIRQGFQRLGEWWEYQTSQWDIETPALPDWGWLEPLGRGLFWLFVAVLVLWITWLLYQAVRTFLNRQQGTPVSTPSGPSEAVLRQAAQWWREAQNLAKQGDYTGACRALYMAGLIRLNDTETVPYLASRTDGEYLFCIGQQAAPRPYQLLIRTHERLTFGGATANEETYQRCRRAYQDIAQG